MHYHTTTYLRSSPTFLRQLTILLKSQYVSSGDWTSPDWIKLAEAALTRETRPYVFKYIYSSSDMNILNEPAAGQHRHLFIVCCILLSYVVINALFAIFITHTAYSHKYKQVIRVTKFIPNAFLVAVHRGPCPYLVTTY